MVAGVPPSKREVEKFDPADLRLRTKTVAPIPRRTAAIPPTMAPAIAPECDDAAGCSLPVPVVVTSALIAKVGALKEDGQIWNNREIALHELQG
jgi:hypothetical protein